MSFAGTHITAVACCLHLLRSGGCAALETSLARWQHNPAAHRRALLAGVTAGALQVRAWQNGACTQLLLTQVPQRLLFEADQT